MIPVDALTENELDRRFDTLPASLRDVLTSERNLNILTQVLQQNRITDENKELMVQQIVALVMLGVVHYYDVGNEINDALMLNNPQFSSSIADELNAKIFNSIKDDLEKNFHPIVGASAAAPASPATPAPTILSESVSGGPSIGAVPLSFNQTKAAPAPEAPKPAPSVGAGWSKTTPSQPVVKLSQTSSPAPVFTAQKPSTPSTPAQPQMPQQIKSPMGEFERLATQKPGQASTSAGSGPAAPAPKPAPSEPAPVILHEDASFKPQQKTADFHLTSTPTQFDMKAPLGPAPVKPAVIEFGGAKPQQPEAQKPSSSATPSTPRMVHYSEYGPAVPGPRQVTELTGKPSASPTPPAMPSAPAPASSMPPKASMPTPSAPPPMPKPAMPPMPPKPPAPPAPGAPSAPPKPENKVIYKDYSEPPKDKQQ